MSEGVKRRAARNEEVSREVNESILRGQWPGEGDGRVGFRCECGQLGCNMLVTVKPTAYREIRSHPRQFLVLPGHHQPELEYVVRDEGSYLVVEKLDDAGEAVRAGGPHP